MQLADGSRVRLNSLTGLPTEGRFPITTAESMRNFPSHARRYDQLHFSSLFSRCALAKVDCKSRILSGAARERRPRICNVYRRLLLSLLQPFFKYTYALHLERTDRDVLTTGTPQTTCYGSTLQTPTITQSPNSKTSSRHHARNSHLQVPFHPSHSRDAQGGPHTRPVPGAQRDRLCPTSQEGRRQSPPANMDAPLPCCRW